MTLECVPHSEQVAVCAQCRVCLPVCAHACTCVHVYVYVHVCWDGGGTCTCIWSNSQVDLGELTVHGFCLFPSFTPLLTRSRPRQ